MGKKTEALVGFEEAVRRIRKRASICEDREEQETARDLRAIVVLLEIYINQINTNFICVEEEPFLNGE